MVVWGQKVAGVGAVDLGDLVADCQLCYRAQHHERASSRAVLAWEKIQIQNLKYFTSEWVLLSYHHKVEKSLSQTIIGWGRSALLLTSG